MQKTSVTQRSARRHLMCASLLTAMLCTFSAHAADQAGSNAARHPIVSTWRWTLFDGKCQETFQYRADGTMLSTSGEAVTQWAYNITAKPDALGFYKAVETSVKVDGKKDCSGDVVSKAGIEHTRFIQMSPTRDRFISCTTESLNACFGPLGRIH